MIRIENVEVTGWEAAIRGMRNPMNSWEKSYSTFHPRVLICEGDLTLMKKLVTSGTDHRKFMRMIAVYMDILAPLYWWKEFDTYKVGTVANSCSTMHTLSEKPFTIDDFSHEHLSVDAVACLSQTVAYLNVARQNYISTKEKDVWWQMIQLLPSSYNQRRTLMLNYEVLRNIYISRKSHKLDEWRTLCRFLETLPYSELITIKEAECKCISCKS